MPEDETQPGGAPSNVNPVVSAKLVEVPRARLETLEKLCERIRGCLATDHVRCIEADAVGLQKALCDAGSPIRKILAEGFYRLVIIETTCGLSEEGCFKYDQLFLPYVKKVLFEAFGIEQTEDFHSEQISQVLKDEPRSLFCFLNSQHIPEPDFERLRSFTQIQHRILLCGPSSQLLKPRSRLTSFIDWVSTLASAKKRAPDPIKTAQVLSVSQETLVHFQIRISPVLYEELKTWAKEERASMNALIVALLERAIAEHYPRGEEQREYS